MSDFKVGEVVILKSGGPKMVIETLADEQVVGAKYKCIWFNTEGGVYIQTHGHFSRETLKPN